MNSETFKNIKDRIKERKSSMAQIARNLGKSPSFISSVMQGNYPYYGAFGMPKYLHDFLIRRSFATEQEITWNRPATGAEIINLYQAKQSENSNLSICTACGKQKEIAYDFWTLNGERVNSSVIGAKQLSMCFACDEQRWLLCVRCEAAHRHEADCPRWLNEVAQFPQASPLITFDAATEASLRVLENEWMR